MDKTEHTEPEKQPPEPADNKKDTSQEIKQKAGSHKKTFLNKLKQKKVIIPAAAVFIIVVMLFLITGPLLVPLYEHFDFADDQVKWAARNLPLDIVEDSVMNTNTDLLEVVANRGKEAVPILIKVLKQGRPRKKSRAANALGKIGPDAEKAIPALIEELDSPNATVRMSAVYGIGNIAMDTYKSFPRIYPLLKDESRYVRMRSAQSLAMISDLNAIPHLKKAIKREPDELCKKFMHRGVLHLSSRKRHRNLKEPPHSE